MCARVGDVNTFSYNLVVLKMLFSIDIVLVSETEKIAKCIFNTACCKRSDDEDYNFLSLAHTNKCFMAATGWTKGTQSRRVFSTQEMTDM